MKTPESKAGKPGDGYGNEQYQNWRGGLVVVHQATTATIAEVGVFLAVGDGPSEQGFLQEQFRDGLNRYSD